MVFRLAPQLSLLPGACSSADKSRDITVHVVASPAPATSTRLGLMSAANSRIPCSSRRPTSRRQTTRATTPKRAL